MENLQTITSKLDINEKQDTLIESKPAEIKKEKIYLTNHGQKLFNAITKCNFDDKDKLELAETLAKYKLKYNVFTFVKSCCELFDTPKKKSLMLFLRTIVPVKDRFSYEEYYKLFFPSEHSPDKTKSIYSDLVPSELLEATFKKAEEKRVKKLEIEKEKAEQKENGIEKPKEVIDEIKMLEAIDLKNNDPTFYELKKAVKSLVLM